MWPVSTRPPDRRKRPPVRVMCAMRTPAARSRAAPGIGSPLLQRIDGTSGGAPDRRQRGASTALPAPTAGRGPVAASRRKGAPSRIPVSSHISAWPRHRRRSPGPAPREKGAQGQIVHTPARPPPARDAKNTGRAGFCRPRPSAPRNGRACVLTVFDRGNERDHGFLVIGTIADAARPPDRGRDAGRVGACSSSR